MQENRFQLFLASFFTLIAAGVGFAVRGGILGDWSAQFGFTQFELGGITGGGLVGFGVVILIASSIIDRVGYKPILLLAFVLHLLSAIITLSATPVYAAAGKDATFYCLYIGMFMFAVGNGLCEAVINPLVADLYPKQKTHYLNILHAGWPGGLIIGGLLAACFTGNKAMVTQLRWEIPMAFFLLPTLYYGFVVFKESFPQSEASAAGVSLGEQFAQFASPILIFLLVLHACVGYVELGTDSWIANITDNILSGQGLILFVYASTIMFVLRFFAGPIVEHINPLGLLLASASLGAVGLYMIGSGTAGWTIWVAVTIYGVGKTFLWPTMLGVVGERFPKGGAVTMGAMGGIGMLSAGLLGGPGIGYTQDYYASTNLEEEAPETFGRYAAAKENAFLFFPAIKGIDGQKRDVVLDSNDKGEPTPGAKLADEVAKMEKSGAEIKPLIALNTWWTDTAEPHWKEDRDPVATAHGLGGRAALKVTALVPLAMAIGYLLLVLYFQSQGGYKQEHLSPDDPEHEGEKYTGGVEGPMEA